MKVEETLARLVAIDSVSARSNAPVISYAAERAESLGMRVRLYPYKDERGVEKINMVATLGPTTDDGKVELALVGHTDTVPYDAAWTDALTLAESDGKLVGRGACDTKGFIAAALTAIEECEAERLARPLALVLTADEEVGCLGAKRLAEMRALEARYSIVGEPTGLRPIRAGKGYCLAEVLVRGREGHSAYPALGASAIFRAARLITHLERIAETLKAERRAEFDPPFTTINVGIVQGGTAKNIIAGECRFTLEWRPVPGQKASRLLDLLRTSVEDERSRDAEFDCEIKVLRIDEGMETPGTSPLVRMLEEATARSAGTISFGTEAPEMQRLGAEAVVLGPGDIRVAHRTGEFVPLEDLRECVSVLARAIEHFCML
ncbi:MAG TPA: acetylornithine deacetylase [Pyrinomonadaceae bacterium]|jgi:acetylornithine deacetylase